MSSPSPPQQAACLHFPRAGSTSTCYHVWFFVLFSSSPLVWALGIELGSSCSQSKPLQTEPWRQSLVHPPVRKAIGGEVLLVLSSRTGPRRGVFPLGPGPCPQNSSAQPVTQIDLSAEPRASQAEALGSALWEKQKGEKSGRKLSTGKEACLQ